MIREYWIADVKFHLMKKKSIYVLTAEAAKLPDPPKLHPSKKKLTFFLQISQKIKHHMKRKYTLGVCDIQL